MTYRKRTILLGIVDGFLRSLFVFLLGEFVASSLINKSYVVDLIASLFCFLLSILFFLIITHYAKEHLLSFYGIGQVTFLLCVLLIMFNYIELHCFLFSKRQLENVDGIILLLAQAIYVLPSEIIRLILLISMSINEMIKKKNAK